MSKRYLEDYNFLSNNFNFINKSVIGRDVKPAAADYLCLWDIKKSCQKLYIYRDTIGHNDLLWDTIDHNYLLYDIIGYNNLL